MDTVFLFGEACLIMLALVILFGVFLWAYLNWCEKQPDNTPQHTSQFHEKPKRK